MSLRYVITGVLFNQHVKQVCRAALFALTVPAHLMSLDFFSLLNTCAFDSVSSFYGTLENPGFTFEDPSVSLFHDPQRIICSFMS